MSNNILLNTIGQPCFKIERFKLLESEQLYNKILNEKRGSFPNQYNIALNILNNINEMITEYSGHLSRDPNGYYCVIIRDKNDPLPLIKYRFIWGGYNGDYEKICHGVTSMDNDENIPQITLIVNSENISNPEIISTIAHELMHCYQIFVKSIGNIDEFLYANLPNFIRHARSEMMRYFFHGLYITFPHEINANVSSIESFLFEKSKKINITNDNIDNIIKTCDKYREYLDMYNFFKTNINITTDDHQYLIKCLQTEINYLTYNKQIVNSKKDILAFYKQTVKKILKRCEYFFEKVNKNKLNFVENRKNS